MNPERRNEEGKPRENRLQNAEEEAEDGKRRS